MKKPLLFLLIAISSLMLMAAVTLTVTSIDDFFLPGSQIGQSGNIETPDRCDNCHGGYDAAVEPAFNWRGSMMAQAARDPLFYACLAVAEKDAPGVGDLCLRCHTPDGWLAGRCEPTDGSALNNNDRQGVQCDFCHKLVKPSPQGVNPYPNDPDYTKSIYNTVTYNQDQAYLSNIIPLPGTTANGMYIADALNAKRGPYADATGRHQMIYSPFHKDAALCGTCHDVSNPAFIRQNVTDTEYTYIKNLPENQQLVHLDYDLRHMFPVERTYSEWMAGGYSNTASGYAKTCQDCHMKDVTGKGAKMKDAKVRNDLPLHDFTGGNTFTPLMVKDQYLAEVDTLALNAGIQRSRQQLKAAATLELTAASGGTTASVKVTNLTGHKLPTGYPEGRRMWINLKVYNGDNLIYESGAYDESNAVLSTEGAKIYECKPGFSTAWAGQLGKPAAPSFNFAINNKIWSDNRIPPKGFSNQLLADYQSPVVDKDGNVSSTMYPDGQNWDVTTYDIPSGWTRVEAKLMYQTTSKEYVEFLRDNGDAAGQNVYDLWVKHGKSMPEIMAEDFVGDTPVAYMDASFISAGREAKRKSTTGVAEVFVASKVSPSTGISGATVTVEYSGPVSGIVQATTGTNGVAVVKTKSVNNPVGEWCFTIIDVTHNDYVYEIPKPWTRMCESESPTAKSGILAFEQSVQGGLNVYPNPFSERLNFEFNAPEDGHAVIDVYDVTGRKLKTVFDEQVVQQVTYRAEFIPENLNGPMVMYRMTLNGEVYQGKVLYTK